MEIHQSDRQPSSEQLRETLKKLIPHSLFNSIQPIYHYLLAFGSAVRYGFPSRRIKVIGVTGTKGKSTVVELVNAMLEEAGYKTALAGTIRFKVAEKSRPNLYKMTMPGRSFVQKFLREAVDAGCQYAVLEMTSEGVKQYRHLFIELDALIFTNIAPEHIESHGSFENYLAAKLQLARALERSHKPDRVMIANADDPHGADFLAANVPRHVAFSLKDLALYTLHEDNTVIMVGSESIRTPLRGLFNVYNMLAALSLAKSQGVPLAACARALERLSPIPGRVEKVERGQDFEAIVDYAHTPDSLRALYSAFVTPAKNASQKDGEPEGRRLICILGNTGGGRDTWKRPLMAHIAEEFCSEIVLTNEDPYDEDPRAIIEAMRAGMEEKTPYIIMDRREAIRYALSLAQTGDAVLITGKGTDPYIMGANGAKEVWSDAQVVGEELERLRD